MPAANDYYSDAAATEPTMPAKEPEPAEGEGDNETTIIPKAVLGGRECKPGEKLEFEVTDVMEDSVAVKFSGYQEEEEPETETAEIPPAPMSQAGQMGPMME